MTQDERWQKRYEEVVGFIETNKRNPSKYVAEERLMVHFLKRGRKMLNAGELAEPRFSQFLKLLELCDKYKRKNQYQ
jgi:hypothetical protein